MDIVEYKKDGIVLKVKFTVRNGVMAAAYTIKLSERNSNNAVAVFDGDNQNIEDDIYDLPLPVSDNHERLLRLVVDFYGVDIGVSKHYSMGMEIFQGDILLKYSEKVGDLTGKPQSELLFVQLKMEA